LLRLRLAILLRHALAGPKGVSSCNTPSSFPFDLRLSVFHGQVFPLLFERGVTTITPWHIDCRPPHQRRPDQANTLAAWSSDPHASTMQITTIGLGIAKNVFQVHGIDARERVVVRKQL